MLRKTILWVFITLLISSFNLIAEDLKFGILPVIDTLPLQVAVHDGYFKEQDLNVELIPFISAMERNTAVHTGQIDGFFGDLIATLLLVDKNLPLKILTISYYTNPDLRMFGLVTSPQFNHNKDNQTLSVAISKASIIEYLLSYVEDLNGANQFKYQAVEIKQMPIRLQMLLAGKIDSALLPEPLTTLAMSKGAKLLATDQTLNMPLTILNLSEQKLPAKNAFLKAYGKAVEAINNNPEQYRDLMAKTCRIPKPLVKSFPVYHYPEPRLPSKAEVDQVQDWMIANQLLNAPIAYNKLVP